MNSSFLMIELVWNNHTLSIAIAINTLLFNIHNNELKQPFISLPKPNVVSN